jgi:transposase
MVGRKGKKKASVAIAHKILVIAYHILKTGTPYNELGADFLEKRRTISTEELMVRRLTKLGYTIVGLPENQHETTTPA